jgi:hypothetical protein
VTGAAESFSEALRALPTLVPPGDEEGPRLRRVLERLGSRAHGTAILLLAIPEALPLPIPSAGAVIGLPLIAVSGHLTMFGERGGLPRRALDWRLPPRVASVIATRVAPVLARAERISRPRLAIVAGKERPAGLACLVLSAILFLPIPLVNLPAAIGLVIVAWGLVQRDGVIVAIGLGYAVAMVVLVAAALAALMDVVR